MGLAGSGYSFQNNGQTIQSNYVTQLNIAGQVDGFTYRYTSAGKQIGVDTWFFDGSNTEQIGLTGGNYAYAVAGGVYQYGVSDQLNNAGQVSGASERYDAGGNSLGVDTWFFNGSGTQRTGLTGNVYGYAMAGGTYRLSFQYLNNSGILAGSSNRYASTGASLGSDSWLYNGSVTQETGLIGNGYNYSTSGGTFETSNVVSLNDAGQILGQSARYDLSGNDLGQDVWLTRGGDTQLIGLSGAGYSSSATISGGTYRSSTAQELSSGGQAIGYSYRLDAGNDFLGEDSWIYNGAVTRLIGLTTNQESYLAAGGEYHENEPITLNNFGEVAGNSARFTANGGRLGQDNWLFDGTKTQQIGLTGGIYGYSVPGGTFQASSIRTLNDQGQVTGVSIRYNSTGGRLGADCWFFNGSSTQQIGLTGGAFSYATTGGMFQFSSSGVLNTRGQVIGYSNRYSTTGSSLGRTSWFFDPSTGVITPLQFSVDSANNFSLTSANVLTDSGLVLGYYELYSGATDEGQRAFFWSLSGGVHDLGSLVAGGLTASGWQELLDASGAQGSEGDGSSQFVMGTGMRTNGEYAYLLVASVPEPTPAGILLLGGMGLLARRRRVAVRGHGR